jgi:drug/metabolite transporter (DMT)-like permease
MAAVVLIWGFGPPVTKLITAPPLVTVSVRFWVSIPLIWAITYASGRVVSLEVLRATAIAGILFGANLLLVVATLQHASVAVLAVLQTLQPGVVLLVAGPVLGERATRWHVAWTGVAVLGVLLVVLGGDNQVRTETVGLVCGVASLLTFTAYYVSNRLARSTTEIDALQWMAGVTLTAGLAVTPVALLGSAPGDYGRLAGADWAYMFFVAVVVGIAGHTMMSWAHKFIAASRSSLYLLGMNVVAMTAAWPINGEPMDIGQAFGGAVVLGAVAAVVVRRPSTPADLPALEPPVP